MGFSCLLEPLNKLNEMPVLPLGRRQWSLINGLKMHAQMGDYLFDNMADNITLTVTQCWSSSGTEFSEKTNTSVTDENIDTVQNLGSDKDQQ